MSYETAVTVMIGALWLVTANLVGLIVWVGVCQWREQAEVDELVEQGATREWARQQVALDRVTRR